MGNENEELRLAEYSTLRNELLQNKNYIFERPLVIITVVGIASLKLAEPSLAFLPVVLAFTLLSNLWFTVNRLQSNARIIAYIATVLEPSSKIKWIGWENSLRIHRNWKKAKTFEEREQKIQKYINLDAIPDAMMFYPALWWLHLVTVVIALGSSGLSLINNLNWLSVIAFISTFAVSCVFVLYCFGHGLPNKMRGLIEIQMATWKAVFEDQPAQ